MPKFIIRPGQKVTHGNVADGDAHSAKMMAEGKPRAAWTAPPVHDYFEGDEIELTADEAAAMPHAVCTPEEWQQMASPKALIEKGYSKEESEAMAAGMKVAKETRAQERKKLDESRGTTVATPAMMAGETGRGKSFEENKHK